MENQTNNQELTTPEEFLQYESLLKKSEKFFLLSSPEPEAFCSAMAFFYSLKELNKFVNPLIKEYPEKLNFLLPGLEFVYLPREYIISIPNNTAEISQILYEKNEDSFKIFLTLQRGIIRKEDILLTNIYEKPDMVISLNVKDIQSYLQGFPNIPEKLFLNTPILKINASNPGNEEESLGEKVFKLIKIINNKLNKDAIDCLIAETLCYTNNLTKNLKPNIFEILSILIKEGGDLNKIRNLMGFQNN